MWYATKRYADLVAKNKTEKQYIKMGSTFFNDAIMEYVEVEQMNKDEILEVIKTLSVSELLNVTIKYINNKGKTMSLEINNDDDN